MSKSKKRNHQQPEQLPQKQDEPNENKLVRHERQEMAFFGPIPHPALLKQYDQVVPGAAERIIKMAEDQAEHRRELEKTVITSDTNNSKKGLYFGFTIGIAGFVLVGILALKEHPYLAGFVAVLDLGSLVTVFVYGSKTRKEERAERQQEPEDGPDV